MHRTHCITTSCRILLLCVVAAPLLCLAEARPASAQDAQEMVLASVVVPQAVGVALTGQGPGGASPKVGFAHRQAAESGLSKNGFELVRVHTTTYSQNRLQGYLSFEDYLGRSEYKAFTIDYASDAWDGYLVRKTDIRAFTPAFPICQVYIVPAELKSLRDMTSMGYEELLAFARDNTVRITPGAMDTSPRTYHVLVFAMDKLQPGDDLVLFADTAQGFSWNKKGWTVAGITTSFAVNGPQQTVFRIFYAPGKGNPLKGNVMALAAFTNRYSLPAPPGPDPLVEISPAAQSLKERCRAKAIPAM